jgi:hypothetical protein
MRPHPIKFAIIFGLLLAAGAVFLCVSCGRGMAEAGTSATAASNPANVTASATAPQPFMVALAKSDTPASIARKYIGQTPYMTSADFESALREANHLSEHDRFMPGERLIIPEYQAEPIQEHPVPVAKDYEVRAIYLTGLMAGSEHGIRLIRRWHELGGNSVVFDIKDSDGTVTIAFDDPLEPRLKHPYIHSLPKLVHFLHSLQMHAIAREALFRDEKLVLQHPELAVQSHRDAAAVNDKAPHPWRENGKLVWTDPSSRPVQNRNIALAKAAAAAGVDEIQFDYVRFPAEGDQADARFAFMQQQPQWTRADVIADFLSRAYGQLHPTGVLLSLDVFGIMAWQRSVDLNHTGQDIVRMAKSCDVLSPMIYPSHFFGMDGYALPGDAPEHFISTSMRRFTTITNGSGAVIRPWLQAFAWRTKTYSPTYIETQVRVAKEHGGIGFLFWNARNDYSRPFEAMLQMTVDATKYFHAPVAPHAVQASAPRPSGQ